MQVRIFEYAEDTENILVCVGRNQDLDILIQVDEMNEFISFISSCE